MVHQRSGPAYAPTSRGTWAVGAAAVVVAGVLAAVVWAQGGFAASSPPQVSTGTAVDNSLFRILPREAEVQSEEVLDETRYQLVLEADLTTKESSPQGSSTLLSLLEPAVRPAGADAEDGELWLVRDGTARPYSWVQPQLTQRVQIRWDLPESIEGPEEVERLRLRVLQAEYTRDFLHEEEGWQSLGDRSADDVAVPVAEG